MKRLIIGLVLLTTLGALAGAEFRIDVSPMKTLPIQVGGRIKPLDTFAREAVRLITGKASFQEEEPVATVLRWWASPEAARQEKNIELRNLALKQKLGLPDERFFSSSELDQNAEFNKLREQVHQRMRGEEELSEEEQEVQQLLVKMASLENIASGAAITVVPNPTGMEQAWGSLADLSHPDVIESLYPLRDSAESLRTALTNEDQAAFTAALEQFRTGLAQIGPAPSQGVMAREVFFNAFHPFRKAWVLYLIGFLCLLFSPAGRESKPYWVGLCLALMGFCLHAYGFYLRCMIAGRPPVTNMYESVIWVAFGAVLFSLIFEYFYKARNYVLASTGAAVICLILADSLPAVLDPSIKPLTPVLRNNFWLTVHVLTITLGYAAFLLSLGLGHMTLVKYAFRPDQEDSLKALNQALYKSIQVGVLFLAAGTILGGVWANYSWGRFWGWDPKEVWALIALLGYLAILHGRYAGWLREFGMAAWSVIAFLGVLMAWYGVNYVLGAGLHSYGFGTGGYQYVSIYVLVECAFVAAMTLRYRNRLRS
ncbi:MAG: cytochrome c biogenesis protein [Vulcanimicrobiota bacterium]